MPCIRLPFRAMRWSMAGGGLIGNLSGHCPASALSGKVMSINIPPGNPSLKNSGAAYRCGDVSVRVALLFRLPGRTDPCWPATAGSASRLKGTSCDAPSVWDGQN